MRGQNNLQTLRGFRDFLPTEKRKRDWVLKKIIETFQIFGFEPLETPTLEYASLLLGKYGEEADKLMYTFEDRGKRKIGLRYDQTVPTARVLGQYQNSLPKFFKRYQVQNVFRADKPQRGRYREFTQCDIDIFESTSPLTDAEILACTYKAYKNIGFDTILIKINNRKNLKKILSELGFDALDPTEVNEKAIPNYLSTRTIKNGWWESIGLSVLQTLDKLDKLSEEEVISELKFKIKNEQRVDTLMKYLKSSKKLPHDLEKIVSISISLGVDKKSIEYVPYLARGLNYYTGMIFEVIIPEFNNVSVGGGGRYDNLIEDLVREKIPAVGMAFGFDRTVEFADQLGLIPSQDSPSTVLVTIFNEELMNDSLNIATQLREKEIATDIYPNATDKLGKQMKYANNKQIPYVVIIGPDEAANNVVTLKNMETGEEKKGEMQEIINTLIKKIIRKS